MGKQKIGKRKSTKKAKPTKRPESEPQSKGNIFDAFVKRMLGRIVVFVDFLLSYADMDFVDAIDLTRIRLAPTHYFGKDGKEQIVDLIFECPLKNGNDSLMKHLPFFYQFPSPRLPFSRQ